MIGRILPRPGREIDHGFLREGVDDKRIARR